MKINALSKWIGASALAVSMAVLPSLNMPAQATANDPVAPTQNVATEDDGFDWGWLGLLGLLGLAGLKGRDRHTTTTTDRVGTTSDYSQRY
ncbi:WGxxGxxG-CTERM domain-containing protein [Nodosilinea sp. LEGE 06152]|uniref:WGxxGxxG family protein n=1 Tax=Nodosilinea sp. LEGE 06152 TaxID=2777966 RepID=UPI0018800513|nr:WGxxGxxG family protein [Nodosilinea sp. LEGE 06152]MBE9160287.1 WGxxGxxG-CTERM domain-containing protein [Nodosilinea sp. LEGE 06152]